MCCRPYSEEVQHSGTRFTTFATPPQTKTPVKTTFRDWCLYSSFVHGPREHEEGRKCRHYHELGGGGRERIMSADGDIIKVTPRSREIVHKFSLEGHSTGQSLISKVRTCIITIACPRSLIVSPYSVLCTGLLLYVCYSFLLISNKFCD